jgi:hypothetical protein
VTDQRKVLSRSRRIGDSGDQGADDPGNQQLQGDQQQHADNGNDQHTDIISSVLEDEMEGFQGVLSLYEDMSDFIIERGCLVSFFVCIRVY